LEELIQLAKDMRAARERGDEYVLIDVGCLKELGIEWSEQKPTTAAC
jgi:hypothetical protein